MSKEVALPFPIKGYDANWSYSAQPPLTTPGSLNVRGYSSDEQRARGGSRPGARRAYTQQIGGGAVPVQCMAALDYGYGDTVFFGDLFGGVNASLQDVTEYPGDPTANPPVPAGPKVWPGADITLKVLGGYVHPSGGTLPYADFSSGEYNCFAGDTWNDFVLDVGLKWGYGTTGDVTLWVSGTSGSASGGARVQVAYASSWISWPGLGFSSVLTITLESGSHRATYSRPMGVLVTEIGGALHVEAGRDAVRVQWDGLEVASVARDDGTCSKAGFLLSMSKPAGSPMPDELLDFRLLNWKLSASTRATAIARKLVAVAGGSVWAESSEGTLGQAAEDPGAPLLANAALYSAAHCNGNLFIVDGASPVFYNPMATVAADKVQPWTARKGRLDPSCRLIVNWRNRLVLAGADADPQNFFLSRRDDPWDFEFSATDSKAAAAAGLAETGRVGDPITALCPLADNVLVIGCSRSLWVMHGDPLAGGSLLCKSDQAGILGPNAWATDPQGNLYFLGEGGLYVMPPLGAPKNLSAARIPALASCSAVQSGRAGASGQTYVTLVYDAARHGLMIFLSPYASGPAVHYFYDLRNDAFWPESYPDAIGPTCAVYYGAATPACRKLLLGGRNGWLYQFDESSKSDNVSGAASAIGSHVWIGPVRLAGGLHDAVVTGVAAVLSSGSDAATYGIHAAATPEAVLAASAAAGGTWSAGRNVARCRVRGGAHAVQISNAQTSGRWATESLSIEVEPGGRSR
jgi:hypothetical protein